MLRKILTLGALALVAVAFGVGTATASPPHGGSASFAHGQSMDGLSDGRFG